MAKFPAMPLYTDAYIADTMDLSLEEHGCYLKLLMLAWRSPGCELPDDDARIAMMLGISTRHWRQKLRPVMEKFWAISDKKWQQKKQLSVRKKAEEFHAQRVEASAAAARLRALKQNNTAPPSDTPVDTPSDDPTDTPKDPPTDRPRRDRAGHLTSNQVSRESIATNESSSPGREPDPTTVPAGLLEVGNEVLALAGVLESSYLGTFDIVAKWLRAGADPETDIYPVIAEVAKRPSFAWKGSLRYFDGAVMEALNERLAEADEAAKGPPPNLLENETRDWWRVHGWALRGSWLPEYGMPAPDDPDCPIADHIIAHATAKAAEISKPGGSD